MLSAAAMLPAPNDGWTLPLHILMWTVLSVGLVAVMVVVLLN